MNKQYSTVIKVGTAQRIEGTKCTQSYDQVGTKIQASSFIATNFLKRKIARARFHLWFHNCV